MKDPPIEKGAQEGRQVHLELAPVRGREVPGGSAQQPNFEVNALAFARAQAASPLAHSPRAGPLGEAPG
eukprot:15457990-Alexandrium_andersonii.AAC.1